MSRAYDRWVRSGELAKSAGVHVETLRYYERRGLLAEPPRRSSGHRDYPEDAVARLRMIKQAQALGLTLDEIAELLVSYPDGAVACGDVESRILAKIEEVDRRIAALAGLRGTLQELVGGCCAGGEHPDRACPALTPCAS